MPMPPSGVQQSPADFAAGDMTMKGIELYSIPETAAAQELAQQ